MRLHRFYVVQPLGEDVVINDVSLVNQWTKVFRYTIGDFVILFNGDGYDYSYSLNDITKKSCSLTRTKQDVSYIPSQKVTLCLSVIKKDNFELVTQKATELGITSIIPILSSRSEKKNLSFERLEKISIESAEQCGRGDIPTVSPITTLKEVLDGIRPDQTPILLHMEGESLMTYKQTVPAGNEIMLFIGPEGGWGDEDLSMMKEKGMKSYSLGRTVLRAETAAIVAVAIIAL